mmetsp:Transcript_24783/g.44756  ORF Transcript_24783/g.44756 Transcript_24783/m.44756 type:complete len:209 (-) Transcript_24783:760-1386(-)
MGALLEKVGREATDEKLGPRAAGCFVLALFVPTIFLKAAEEVRGPGPNDGNSSWVTLPTAVFFSRPPPAFRTPFAVHPTNMPPVDSDAAAASRAGKAFTRPAEDSAEAAVTPPCSLSLVLAACALISAVRAACIGWDISGSFTCLCSRCSGSASGTNASPFRPNPKSFPVGTFWFEKPWSNSPSLRTRNSSLIFVPPSLRLVPWKLAS